MLNQVSLLGRITKDLEVKVSAAGGKVLNFTLAVSRDKDRTEFISCVAYSKTAELINLYCKKGSQLALTGSLHCDSYQKIGTSGTYTVYYTEVWVDNVTFVDKKESAPKQEAKPSPIEASSVTADELPF